MTFNTKFGTLWLSCLALTALLQYTCANVIYARSKTTVVTNEPKDCVFVTSGTGYFKYVSTTDSPEVCGIYVMTESQNLVEIVFTEFDVPCSNTSEVGNLVQYMDGWELNQEIFPSNSLESPVDVSEYCSDNKPFNRVFVSSQNGALISYRIPEVGRGFTIHVAHKKHPSPCNIIHFDEPYVILKNHGKKKNCSLWAPYPTVLKLNSYSVGDPQLADYKCSDSSDRIEIGGGGLDVNQGKILDSICNKSIWQSKYVYYTNTQEEIVSCSSTTVKLVSQGGHQNYLNITMRVFLPEEIVNAVAKYQCTLPVLK